MANTYFTGEAIAVAQVDTVQITADDAATTYKITIGGIVVSVSGTGTGVNDTATALQVALEASTHPYFEAIAFTVATDTVTMTASVAGCPFTATSSVAGGAGTIGAVTSSTACTGPNHYDDADNWSGGAVPVNADTVHIDSNVNICWGLAQSAVTLGALTIYRNTGKIGLAYDQFATSADGDSYSSTQVPEYRDHYLNTLVNGDVIIGRHLGPGDPAGSGRIKLDLGNQATTIQVEHAGASAEQYSPSVRLLTNCATTDLFVRSAEGGVGVAIDEPDETSTIRMVSISDDSTNTRAFTGPGTTITTWEQTGGDNILQVVAAGTATTVNVDGGILTTEGGNFTVTTGNVAADATLYPNHLSSGVEWTTLNNRGTIDTSKSNQARTITTLNPYRGATFIYDKDVMTITNGDPSVQDTGVSTITYG